MNILVLIRLFNKDSEYVDLNLRKKGLCWVRVGKEGFSKL